jgi:hypothetical protein
MTDAILEYGGTSASDDEKKDLDITVKSSDGSITVSNVPDDDEPLVADHERTKLDVFSERATAWLAKQGLEGHGSVTLNFTFFCLTEGLVAYDQQRNLIMRFQIPTHHNPEYAQQIAE